MCVGLANIEITVLIFISGVFRRERIKLISHVFSELLEFIIENINRSSMEADNKKCFKGPVVLWP